VELTLTRPWWVVSGWRQAGKSLFCRQVGEAARQAGFCAAGLLTPGRYVGDVRTGILAQEAGGDVTRLLASRDPHEVQGGENLGPWYFDAGVFAWGNRRLQAIRTCDLLCIDELGPLEFDAGRGWQAAFSALERADYRLALIVVRPECLARLPQGGRIVWITPGQETGGLVNEALAVLGKTNG